MKFCDQIKLIPARLVLQNGEVYEGASPDWCEEDTFGEVVFTTGMTGYVESITDPSFAGQILTFTFPLIGNYGVPDQTLWESSKIHLRGLVFSEISSFCDHHQAIKSLHQWLKEQKIPYICGVDTRALTKSLRTQGTSLGAIATGKKDPKSFPDPSQTHLVDSVSTKEVCKYGKGKKKIIAVDCGMKENIIRSLLEFPIEVHRVPFDYDYSEEEYDGVFISNGPGDPIICKETIAVLQKALKKKKPVFGICLGAQLLALAIGAKTFKLPYGHRGQNQPCEYLYHTRSQTWNLDRAKAPGIDDHQGGPYTSILSPLVIVDPRELSRGSKSKFMTGCGMDSGRCFLSSQNHGYAIDEKTLPKEWVVTFRNLNDSSVEGIAHKTLPFFAVQFHPEASPGPTDTLWLFEKFYKLL